MTQRWRILKSPWTEQKVLKLFKQTNRQTTMACVLQKDTYGTFLEEVSMVRRKAGTFSDTRKQDFAVVLCGFLVTKRVACFLVLKVHYAGFNHLNATPFPSMY